MQTCYTNERDIQLYVKSWWKLQMFCQSSMAIFAVSFRCAAFERRGKRAAWAARPDFSDSALTGPGDVTADVHICELAHLAQAKVARPRLEQCQSSLLEDGKAKGPAFEGPLSAARAPQDDCLTPSSSLVCCKQQLQRTA